MDAMKGMTGYGLRLLVLLAQAVKPGLRGGPPCCSGFAISRLQVCGTLHRHEEIGTAGAPSDGITDTVGNGLGEHT